MVPSAMFRVLICPRSDCRMATVWYYSGPMRSVEMPWVSTLRTFYTLTPDGFLVCQAPRGIPSAWFDPCITKGNTSMCNQFAFYLSGQRDDQSHLIPSDVVWMAICELVESGVITGAKASGMAASRFNSLNPFNTRLSLHGTDEQIARALHVLLNRFPEHAIAMTPRKQLRTEPVPVVSEEHCVCPTTHLIILDTETTGLPPHSALQEPLPARASDMLGRLSDFRAARMIQVAWKIVHVRQWKVMESGAMRIRPARCELTADEECNMYGPSKLLWQECTEKGQSIHYFWQKLQVMLDAYPNLRLVCHNVRFDMRIVASELARYRKPQLYERWVSLPKLCTAESCNFKRLQTLHTTLCGKAIEQTHRADDDVDMLFEVLPHLIRFGWVDLPFLPAIARQFDKK